MLYRYERKYYVPVGLTSSVEVLIKRHSARFNPHFASRQINNIYFDTLDLDSYQTNLDSVPLRLKVRLRWYGQAKDLVEKSSLEIKIKDGYLNRKHSFRIKPWHLGESVDLYQFLEHTVKDFPLLYRHKLIPTVANSYHRHYYLSADEQLRATVDSRLRAYPLRRNTVKWNQGTNILGSVLEFKYQQKDDQVINQIIDRFPFRLSSCSKYALALEQVSPLGR